MHTLPCQRDNEWPAWLTACVRRVTPTLHPPRCTLALVVIQLQCEKDDRKSMSSTRGALRWLTPDLDTAVYMRPWQNTRTLAYDEPERMYRHGNMVCSHGLCVHLLNMRPHSACMISNVSVCVCVCVCVCVFVPCWCVHLCI